MNFLNMENKLTGIQDKRIMVIKAKPKANRNFLEKHNS
jgi:hypothetical protein